MAKTARSTGANQKEDRNEASFGRTNGYFHGLLFENMTATSNQDGKEEA